MIGAAEEKELELEDVPLEDVAKPRKQQHGEQLVAYTARLHMLAILCASNLVNGSLNFTFSAVSTTTTELFQVSSTSIAVLLAVINLLYAPGTYLGQAVGLYSGLRGIMLTSACIMFVATALRAAGGAVAAHSESHTAAYTLIVLGQLIAGVAQPLAFNASPALATKWFRPSERDMAVAAGTMSNTIGTALGQILPAFLVAGSGLKLATFLYGQALFSVLVLVWVYLCFREEPPTPPSYSAEVVSEIEHAHHSENIRAALKESWHNSKKLLRNKNFVLLIVAFGFGLAVFTSFLSVINEFASQFGFTEQQSGLIGSLMTICGLAGGVFIGIALSRTHWYLFFFKSMFILSTAGAVAIVVTIRLGNIVPVLFISAILGFSLVSTSITTIECSTECTFPIPEVDSTGILFSTGNVMAVPLVLVFHLLIEEYDFALEIFMSVLMIVACICAMMFNGEYLRMNIEKQKQLEHEEPQPVNVGA